APCGTARSSTPSGSSRSTRGSTPSSSSSASTGTRSRPSSPTVRTSRPRSTASRATTRSRRRWSAQWPRRRPPRGRRAAAPPPPTRAAARSAAAAPPSQPRPGGAGRLERLIQKEIRGLGMEHGRFRVALRREPAAGGELAAGPDGWRVGPRGAESAELLLSSNPGEDLRPLAKVVSGGELSRVMLAAKTVLAAADDVPVLVFDEVDAGIGGRVADVVGQKLAASAAGRQVL